MEKATVANPLDFRNTVGGELADMFKARGIEDFEERLGVKDLRKTVFNRKSKGAAMRAVDLAREFNVQPIFASYWLRKTQCAPTFQSKVSIDFTDRYQ